MDLKLTGKKAVVLGGTRGIGRAIAETLMGEGAEVAICARSADQLETALSELSTRGKAIGAALDVADGEALTTWISSAGNELGGIDILIANASAIALGADRDAWDRGLNVDVMGAVNSFTAAEPFLEEAAKKNGDAAFTAIASIATVDAQAPQAYGAMKSALIHYMRGVAKTSASKGIRANVVSPGYVYFEGGSWGMVKEHDPDYYARAIAENPTGRLATPEEIADATVFLSSPRSSYTTGVNLLVDGALSNRVNF